MSEVKMSEVKMSEVKMSEVKMSEIPKNVRYTYLEYNGAVIIICNMGGFLLCNCIKVSKYMYQANKKVTSLEICICRKLHFIVVIATLLKMSINIQKGR